MLDKTPLGILVRNIENIQKNINKIFKEAIDNQEIRRLIIELNTTVQLEQEHVDSTGKFLFNNFTNSSVYLSEDDPFGRTGQRYEVFYTGEYYRSFRVTVGDFEIIISSDPIKEEDNLFEVYTPLIEGLTESSLEIVRKESRKYFERAISNEINKGL